jgi:hypothetical protein
MGKWAERNSTEKKTRRTEERLDALAFARERLGFKPEPRQAEVLQAKTKRGILNCTRQWGKSTVTAAKAVHRAWTHPKSLVLVVSPGERQSGLFLEKAEVFVRALGLPVRGDGYNDLSLMLPNGSRMVGLPGKPETVRGFSGVSLLVVDEAAQVSNAMYDAVTPMIAASRGELWLMSTPNGKRGFFWEEWSRGGELWTRVRVPATECPRIDPEYLDEERRRKTERVFAQEYMCEFGDAEAAVFSEDSIQRALRWDIEPMKVPPFEPRKKG